MQKLLPFVKWVGGKRQILLELKKRLPKSNNYQRYFEPFLGGGALFLALKPKKAILNVINRELINTWQIIQKHPQKLIKELFAIKKIYSSEEDFYSYRKQYNNLLTSSSENKSQIEKAALFIFLNKTCFNGLYRVNRKGQFNTPWNHSLKFNFDDQNILAVHKFLKDNEIKFHCQDFQVILKKAQKGDLIYLDPPYDLLTKDTFTSYTKDNFLQKEQEILAKVFQKLNQKGCCVVLSNHKTPRIEELYKKFYKYDVLAKRMINCKGQKRGNVSELIITNINENNV